MATLNQANIFASTAAVVENVHSLSHEARLFRWAIQEVKQNDSESRFDESFISQFETAERPEDFLKIFGKYRKENLVSTLHPHNSRKARLKRSLRTFLALRGFGDSATIANQTIAAPVWGVICAALTIVQSIFKFDAKLESMSKRLETFAKQHRELLKQGDPFDELIEAPLRDFNKLVVEFAFKIGTLLSKGRLKSWRNVATNKLPDILDGFTEDMKGVNESMTSALLISTNNKLTLLNHAQAFPPSPAARPQDNNGGGARAFRIPETLSDHFVGRSRELEDIYGILHRTHPFGTNKCALVGIGGVGKSQLALRYLWNNFKGRYQRVYFARADSKVTLQNELCLIAERLGLGDSLLAQTEGRKMIERLKFHLQDTDDWLFVFDNLSDASDIRPYLPSDAPGHIVITTRNQLAAESLVGENNIIEVKPLHQETEAIELIFKLGKAKYPSDAQRVAAADIAKFAGGLPLAIDQMIKFTRYSNKDWESALQDVSTKRALLEQQSFNSNHEQGLSIGAIVGSLLTDLQKKNPKAVSLFKVLVYLNPASIPIGIFEGAKSNLDDHFQRKYTYVKGQLRYERDLQRIAQLEMESKRPFCLWDYDPFEKELFRKIFRMGHHHPRYRDTALPRIDFEADVKLQSFWASEKHTLQAVLDDPLAFDQALLQLEKLGLVRRLKGRHSIWIHDLFAEVTQAIISIESKQLHCNHAHVAATMVFLAFPIPIFPHINQSKWMLPHAISAHRYLRATELLKSTTVGPELSHLIASTIEALGGSGLGEAEAERRARMAEVCSYFRCALQGYIAASQRLCETPGITLVRVILSTFADYEWEHFVSLYTPTGYLNEYRRFGKSAPWRCIQTTAKYAAVLMRQGELDWALLYINKSLQMSELMFGSSHTDTRELSAKLFDAQCQLEQWESAYITARKRAEAFMGLSMTYGPEPSKVSDLGLQRQALCPFGYSFDEWLQLAHKSERKSTNQSISEQIAMLWETTRYQTLRPFRAMPQVMPIVMIQLLRTLGCGLKVTQIAQKPVFVKEPAGLIDSEYGCELATNLGEASAHIKGKEGESLFWYNVAMKGRETVCGRDTRETVHSLISLSKAHMRVAEATECVTENGEDQTAASKRKSNYHRALAYSLHAAEIAVRGPRTGDRKGYLAPTLRERLEAGELPIDSIPYEPQNEEEQQDLDEYLRGVMKDTFAEEMIKEARHLVAQIPEDVLDEHKRLEIGETELAIGLWEKQQEWWQTKTFPVPPGSIQHNSSGINLEVVRSVLQEPYIRTYVT